MTELSGCNGAQRGRSFQLWAPAEVVATVEGFEPLLASWEKASHPAQVRLNVYLDWLMRALGPLPEVSTPLALLLIIDVGTRKRLTHHYDLENYLTPLFGSNRLDQSRFTLVKAVKTVGVGSSLLLSTAKPASSMAVEEWEHFSFLATAGLQTKRWKTDLREALLAARVSSLPSGLAAVRLAWRCSPARNWVQLWKPTLDSMGPVLGGPSTHPFNPADDRVASLELHADRDASVGWKVEVGMWWRAS